MRILITGIAGHLGSRFAEWILRKHPEVKVVGVDNFCSGYRENVPSGVEFHEIDLASGELDKVFFSPCDYIFHFAAYAAECLSPFIRRYNYANNLVGTANVVNAAINSRRCRRLVFTSSIAVYGDGTPPFAESHACHPKDPYGVAKLACEMDLRIAGNQHALDWCILRPHNIYGPGQSLWQRYRNVFGLWMRAALEGEPLRIFGDGQQLRAFSYIDDILPCLWEAAVAPRASQQVVNLGGAEPIAIREAAATLVKIIGDAAIEHCEPRYEVKRAWCTVEESRSILGYREVTPLGIGLEEMWDWARGAWREHPQRREQLDSFALEVEHGIYECWRPDLRKDSPSISRSLRPVTPNPS